MSTSDAAVLKRGDDTEVATAAAESPEQVLVLGRARTNHLSLCGDNVRRQEVVAGEPMTGHQPAESTAERESRDTRRRHHAPGRREPEGEGCAIQLAPGHAPLRAYGPSIGLHLDGSHRREVDHDAVLVHGEAGDVVTAPTNGHPAAVRAREPDRGNDVLSRRTPNDQCAAFDQSCRSTRA